MHQVSPSRINTTASALHFSATNSTIRRIAVLLQWSIFLSMALTQWACNPERRQAPYPVFHAEQPLGISDPLNNQARPADDFADLFNPVTEQNDARRQVVLGREVISHLPDDPTSWRWAHKGGLTLIRHDGPDGLPDLLILTESFSILRRRLPSAELLRWILTISPELLGNRFTSGLPDNINSGSELHNGVASSVMGAAKLLTATYGVGLGFESLPETWSGWKWIGHNEQGLKVRLSRVEGSWIDPSAAISDQLKRFENLSGVDLDISQLFQRIRAQDERAPLPQRSAFLLLGYATQSPTDGFNIAVVCPSTCPQAREIAQIINRAHQASSTEIRVLLNQEDQIPLAELEQGTGLILNTNSAVRDGFGKALDGVMP